MTDQAKEKLKYWLIGLFTGGAVAAPVTVYITKKVYEQKIDEAETRAMNDMAAYAVQQQAVKLVTTSAAQQEPSQDIQQKQEDEGDDILKKPLPPIDEEEAALAEEAYQRYMDKSDVYRGEATLSPYFISREKYESDYSVEHKSSINWYMYDDVFEENLERISDPYSTFGVVSGKQLFEDTSGREDPDICYIRNEEAMTDFEVNRIRGSYSEKVGGERRLGETDT